MKQQIARLKEFSNSATVAPFDFGAPEPLSEPRKVTKVKDKKKVNEQQVLPYDSPESSLRKEVKKRQREIKQIGKGYIKRKGKYVNPNYMDIEPKTRGGGAIGPGHGGGATGIGAI